MPTVKKINNIALFLALLFHVSGAIGMILTPYKDWFISYTPFTLLVMFVLLLLTQEQKNSWFWLFVVLCFITGLAVEIIGVNKGWIFGEYVYGDVLGPKLLNVPLLIGVNWFTAVYCAANLVYVLNEWLFKKLGNDMRPSIAVMLFAFVTDAAMVTTFFDWIMEPTAVQLGFWKWLPAGEIPLYNFICWFVISALLQTAFRLFKFPKPNQFAVHLLIIELLFFLVLQTFL